MPESDLSPPSGASPAHAAASAQRVSGGFSCSRCGYDLAGARIDGDCPECGSAVAEEVIRSNTVSARTLVVIGARLLALWMFYPASQMGVSFLALLAAEFGLMSGTSSSTLRNMNGLIAASLVLVGVGLWFTAPLFSRLAIRRDRSLGFAPGVSATAIFIVGLGLIAVWLIASGIIAGAESVIQFSLLTDLYMSIGDDDFVAEALLLGSVRVVAGVVLLLVCRYINRRALRQCGIGTRDEV